MSLTTDFLKFIFKHSNKELIFKLYLKYQDRLHKSIIANFSPLLFNGLHPKNVFNYRMLFFIDNVGDDDVVLDVACGTGSILKSISPCIKFGVGIEKCPENINFCLTVNSAENLKYISEDLFKIDYNALKKESGYSVAVFSHILEHIEDVPLLLKKVDADSLLICVPSQENWYTQLLIHLGLPYFKDPSHFREYTRVMLENELKQAGYAIQHIGFNPEGEIICKAIKDS